MGRACDHCMYAFYDYVMLHMTHLYMHIEPLTNSLVWGSLKLTTIIHSLFHSPIHGCSHCVSMNTLTYQIPILII